MKDPEIVMVYRKSWGKENADEMYALDVVILVAHHEITFDRDGNMTVRHVEKGEKL